MGWGIWNGVTKRFIFGLDEPTREKAEKAFIKKAGKAAYKWRFTAKRIPADWVNPKNEKWRR